MGREFEVAGHLVLPGSKAQKLFEAPRQVTLIDKAAVRSRFCYRPPIGQLAFRFVDAKVVEIDVWWQPDLGPKRSQQVKPGQTCHRG